MHGLVVGKFYPPHAGHHLLVRTAAAQAAQVTVLVMSTAAERLSMAERVAWMQAEHPGVTVRGIVCDAPVDYDSQPVWAAQVACMKAVVRERVDIVFSSEKYGDELAAWFGAVHVPVDPLRTRAPISGTACRADLYGNWSQLAPATRAGLAARIVVVGAESTGTTTVSRALAAHYRHRWPATEWVPEYGREVVLERVAAGEPFDEIPWTAADFAAIAAHQQQLEETAARRGAPVLICDTDAFATTVWERRYLGTAAPCLPLAPRRRYLLTDHVGVPFVQDGIRDGEHIRADMTGWFVDALTAAGLSWVLLTGTLDERVGLAVRVTDRALAAFHDFA